MRIFLTIAFILNALLLSAQCPIEVNPIRSYCTADGNSWVTEIQVNGAIGGSFEIPAFQITGAYNSGDTIVVGPFSPNSTGQFLIRDSSLTQCIVFHTPLPPQCPGDDCFGFGVNIETFLEGEICLDNASEVSLEIIRGVYPVGYVLYDSNGDIVEQGERNNSNQRFINSFLPAGDNRLTLTDANGCMVDTSFFVETVPCVTLEVRSWLDNDEDGLQDQNETTNVGGTMELLRFGEVVNQSSTTNGIFFFDQVPFGQYTLRMVANDSDLMITRKNAGNNPELDSDANPGTNMTDLFFLQPGDFVTEYDFGWNNNSCDSLAVTTFADPNAAPCSGGAQLVDVFSSHYPVEVQIFDPQNRLVNSAILDEPQQLRFDNLESGGYTLIVSNVLGCEVIQQFDVSTTPFLDVSIAQRTAGCEGELSLLAVTDYPEPDSLEFNWNTGATTASISPVTAGTFYDVTITGPQGCFGFAETVATPVAPFTVAVIDTTDQSQCGVGHIFTLEGGSSPFAVRLQDPDGNFLLDASVNDFNFQYFNLTQNGAYVFTATDANGCTVDTTLTITDQGCGNVIGRSWWDEDGDGIQDATETQRVNAAVRLFDTDGNFYGFAPLTEDGTFTFADVPSGEYFYTIYPRENSFSPTLFQQGSDPELDSDLNRTTNRSVTFTVGEGQTVRDVDAGWRGGFCNENPNFSISTTPSQEGTSCSEGQQFVGVNSMDYPVFVEILGASNEPLDTFSVFNGEAVLVSGLTEELIYIVATDPNGCVIWTNFDVLFGPANFTAEVNVTGDICAGDPLVLTAVTNPDTLTGLTFEWNTGETTASITVDTIRNDIYRVRITDRNGCSVWAEYFPFEDLDQDIGLPDTTAFACGDDFAVLSVPEEFRRDGAVFRWFGPLNQILEGPEVTVTMPGFYRLFGNSPRGCSYSGSTMVVNRNLEGNIDLVAFSQDTLCNGLACLSLEGIYALDYTNIDIDWTGPPEFTFENDTLNFVQICTPYPGLYTATLRSDCDTVTFSYEVESLSCTILSGTLWVDDAANCSLDAEDIPAPNFLLSLTNEANGDIYYTITEPDGQWSIELPTGTYLIEPIIQEGQPFATCPNPTQVSLGNIPVTGVNVYLPVLVDCPQLRTSVTMPFLRRCFTNVAFVEYENTGSATAEDAVLTVTLDDLFTNVNTTPAFSSRDGQVLTFNLGDVPPFTSGRISILFTLSCQADLGQSHCVEAAITPDAPCVPDPNWSGALVDVSGAVCDGDSIRFSIVNIGQDQMTVPLSYIVVEDGIMLSPEPFVNGLLEEGELMEIVLPAEGSTYLVITNQEPNAPGPDQPSAALEGCGENPNGGTSLGFSNLWALTPGNPARSIACRENVGAYDPNDKTAYPVGYDGNNIPFGTRLEYDIRFQNTGTDTAFTVVIRDTLSEALDLATFKPEAASHPYTVSIDTHRVVTFTFENIMLPDSNVNLAGSQGVVQFSINHDTTLQLGSVIDNNAAIYFDFNEPIITNVTRRRIAKEGLPVSTRPELARTLDIRVYPNPTDGLLKVELPVDEVSFEDQLVVMDVHGRPLLRKTYGQLGQGLNVAELPTGYYLLVVTDAAGNPRGRAAFIRR